MTRIWLLLRACTLLTLINQLFYMERWLQQSLFFVHPTQCLHPEMVKLFGQKSLLDDPQQTSSSKILRIAIIVCCEM